MSRVAACEAGALLGDHLAALPYPDCITGPDWLTSELLAGDGREKLTRWLDTAPPPPWPDKVDVADTERALAFRGDYAALTFTAVTIAHLPPPVRDYAISRVQFVGTLAWAGFCGIPEPEDATRPRAVVVTPGARGGSTDEIIAAFQHVAAHEIAHCWIEPEPEPGARWMPAAEQAFLEHGPYTPDELAAANPEAARRLRRWQAAQRARETPVEALCRAWGLTGHQPRGSSI